MPHRGLRGVAFLLAMLMTWAVLPWAHAQGGPIVPGVSLADIPLGTPIAELVQRLGAPSEVRLASADGTVAYVFGQYGITAYTRSNVVVALTTTNSVLGMINGVGLGTPQSAVAAAFGVPPRPGTIEGLPALRYDSLGIAFGIDRQAVAVVMIFPPSPSATPAGVPPAAPPALPAPRSVNSQAVPGTGSTAAAVSPGAPSAVGGTASTPSGPVAVAPAAPGSPAVAATAAGDAGGLPDVSRLRPFTAETQFMSVLGYLRWLVYRMTGQWLNPENLRSFVYALTKQWVGAAAAGGQSVEPEQASSARP